VHVAERLEDEREQLLEVSPPPPVDGLGDGLEVIGVEVAELGKR